MSAVAAPSTAAAPPADRPLLPPLAARFLATGALGAFAALHWGWQLEPSRGGRMLAMLAVALAGGLALGATAGLARPARLVARALLFAALAAAALIAAGVPGRLLAPGGWAELDAQISAALTAMPGIRVPYRGVDEWVQRTIMLGGTLLLALGAAAALWPRGGGASRALALLALGLLFAVPAVESELPGQLGRGLAFAALIAAFLTLERVRMRRAAPAVAVAGAGLLAGLLAALALDRGSAPLDYERLASSLERNSDPQFDWQHSYGPIRWSRDGGEVLRVRARRSAYWKAENLDGFDGRRWERTQLVGTAAPDAELPAVDQRRPGWLQTVRVRITGMRTGEIVGAGTTLDVARAPQPALPSGSPGTFVVRGQLRRGDAYLARVYVPNPTAEELQAAGVSYPESLDPYRTLEIPNPAREDGPAIPVTYPAFGEPASTRPLALEPTGLAARTGGRITAASVYRGAWALARRLSAAAATPYDFVRAVEAYLGRGFRYTEAPPERAVPLESFLFRDRAGYCQQFSGAMALLLRMGGVPARVATGFAPGTLDRRRGEYVVRDLDAHSWVEAWFPGLGWVPFDPTPSAAPAASQALAGRAPSAGAPGGDRAEPGHKASGAGRGDGGGGPPAWLLAGGAALVAAAGAGGAVLARAGSRPRASDPLLAELERAMARTGRPAAAGTTLRALEARFAGSPDAAGYLRALRDARYGHAAEGPTPAQRGALRRELARGLGPAGRLRAAWALPPRPRRRRDRARGLRSRSS